MQDASLHFGAILRRLSFQGMVVMLDFDGTLAPIVKHPSHVRISARAKRALARLSRRYPVAVVSGRMLADVERMVGVEGLVYAGSHGLEWRMDGVTTRRKVPKRAAKALSLARAALLMLSRRYPGLVVEDKDYSYALNSRSLSSARAKRFRADARAAVAPYVGKGRLRLMDGLGTFEVMPDIHWTKGECARLIYKRFGGGKSDPVYLGDSFTDEDAFKAFPEGITIRVGRMKGSAARYFLPRRTDVDRFLEMLATMAA